MHSHVLLSSLASPDGPCMRRAENLPAMRTEIVAGVFISDTPILGEDRVDLRLNVCHLHLDPGG